jgi:death-on-curing protein
LSDVEYLSLRDALLLNDRLRLGPVCDIGLLDYSLARPRSNAFGNDAYRTTDLKAAALLHSLATNHAVVDENKRIAWYLTRAFLWINGVEPQLGDEEAIVLVIDIAGGSLDLKVIAERLHIT